MFDVEAIKSYVQDNFPGFGVNKRREVIRLLYEISKRERNDFKDVLAEAPLEPLRFAELKKYLMQRRFPIAIKEGNLCHMLPELDINPQNRVNIKKKIDITPKHFVVEGAAGDTALVKRLKEKFPRANFSTIGTYKEYIREKKYTIKDYNTRLETFYIIRENYDFYKRCPCSPKSLSCGYHVVNLGSGCAFECVYCCLQDYLNSPGIVIPANIEDFFEKFKDHKKNIRLGSGELTDSLVFDHITDFSPLIVNFFKNHPETRFEFKTKSDNIANLLRVAPTDNIIVAWSLNPQKIIDTTEYYTASLDGRLAAAVECAKAGYKIAFHFDPMIYYDGWEKDYKDIVRRIFSLIGKARMEWISLGALRMMPSLKKVIENRFPDSAILDEEFETGFDGKMRYPLGLRTMMFRKMREWIRHWDDDLYVYLCMEERGLD